MRFIKYIPVVAWMALIFFLSSRPDLPHANTFFLEFIFKKSGHVFVYFVLLTLWTLTLKKKPIENAISYSLIFAFTDEIHQLFVPTRTGKLSDILIDSLGMSLAVMIYYLLPIWKRHFSATVFKRPKK